MLVFEGMRLKTLTPGLILQHVLLELNMLSSS